MDFTNQTKKYSADKIALLAIFILSLLTARFITAARSGIPLSAPIKLDHAALSISMPEGRGWKHEDRWKFHKNYFTISAIFDPASSNPTTLAHCTYMLAEKETSPEEYFEKKVVSADAQIIESGQLQIGSLTFPWVRMQKKKSLLTVFFGFAQLPNNRQFSLEVHQATDDIKMAEQAFKKIAQSLTLDDNLPLEAGSEFISEIKYVGLGNILLSQPQQKFFLLKNSNLNKIGFTMDLLTTPSRDEKFDIQAASLLYMKGQFPNEQITSFKSSDQFDEFIWKSETSSLSGNIGTEINMDKDGTLTISRFSPPTEDRICFPGTAAIPVFLFDSILAEIITFRSSEIIIDFIDTEGRIFPVLISKKQPDSTAPEQTQYVLNVELFDDRGFSRIVYLDDQMQILKILIKQKTLYILEKTTPETVIRYFPERANFIMEKNKMLEQTLPNY